MDKTKSIISSIIMKIVSDRTENLLSKEAIFFTSRHMTLQETMIERGKYSSKSVGVIHMKVLGKEL